MLDTNIIVFCLRGRSPRAMRRLIAATASSVLIPLQVHAELLVGAAKSSQPSRNLARVLSFVAPFQIVCPDSDVEEHYVAIRTDLETRGVRISEADLWIAATAMSKSCILVTNNIKEFSRVSNLIVEDWT